MVALPDLNMKKTMNARLKSVKPVTLIIRWMIQLHVILRVKTVKKSLRRIFSKRVFLAK